MDARFQERNALNVRMVEIYNFNSGKIEQADYWLSQDEEKLFKLRYSLRKDRKAYGCPVCKTPVNLLRSSKQNWFFRHLQRAEGVRCALIDDHMPTRQKRIQQYNVAKETEEHKNLKNFIGDYLRNDTNVIGEPQIEKVLKGKWTPTKWKRPDVRCKYGEWDIVFEVQISNTWLSDIVDRDTFYTDNKTIIIWVFNSFDSCRPNQDTTKADIFYNNPEVNLFVLDKPAIESSEETNQLMLNCYYRLPEVDYQKQVVSTTWKNQLVTLSDLSIDPMTYKPYVVSYYDKQQEAQEELQRWKDELVRKRREERELRFKREIEARKRTEREGNTYHITTTWNQPEESIQQKPFQRIEDRCPKEFSEMSPRDCIDLLFGENYLSRNVNTLRNRIFDLELEEFTFDVELEGFSFPNDVIHILEERGWIKRMPGHLALINYERGDIFNT